MKEFNNVYPPTSHLSYVNFHNSDRLISLCDSNLFNSVGPMPACNASGMLFGLSLLLHISFQNNESLLINWYAL